MLTVADAIPRIGQSAHSTCRDPPPTLWNYQSSAGVTTNGSPFTSGNPNAPAGSQVGFIQQTGSASQLLSLTGGNYTLSFYAAQRGNGNATYQQVHASLQQSTAVASTKQFIWIGNRIAEERDANNNVVRRFYPQGEQINGTSYFYTRDHLGSVRELTDSTAVVRARYDYDPYGYRTKLSGDLDAEFGYTGHYFHQPSSMNLALHRANDASSGRWLSRDPIGEEAGTNLYTYAINDPLRLMDPLGLDVIVLFNSNAVGIGSHFPQGHIATLIGSNATGWTYYSRNGYDGWPWQGRNGDFTRGTFDTFKDFKDSGLGDQYDQAYHIRTGPDQDLAMIEYGDEHDNEPYHSIIPPSNNCADLTEEILDAGGNPITGDNQYPLYSDFGYIGGPEVPKFLFPNIIRSGIGYLWNVPP